MLETLGAMGLQCFCFWCAGKVVGRSTFYRHGAHDRPPSARDRQPKEQAGFVSVENAEGLEQMSDSDGTRMGAPEAVQGPPKDARVQLPVARIAKSSSFRFLTLI